VKIAGSYSLHTTAEQAYTLLQDPEVLAKSMPGCDHLNRIGPDEYEMKMKMAISSIHGLFAGKVRIEDANPPHSFKLVVEGTGKVGFMKGSGMLHLAAHDGFTQVAYDGEVQVGGMIASVGQRLMETTAKFIIRKFFEKLAAQVPGEPPAVPPPDIAETSQDAS
jgi:carbon monoxide dehydrogenase subunit G